MCGETGNKLIQISTEKEFQFLQSIAAEKDKALWIGLRQADGSKEPDEGFYWVGSNETSQSALIWSVGGPDNFDGIEHCVHLKQRNRMVNDRPCSWSLFALCECFNIA